MSFLKAQVSFRSSVASVFSAIKHNSSILYLAQTLYTLVKGSPLKCKFLRFLSTRVKIYQSLHLIFAPFFILMTHNSPVNLKLVHFQLWTKESHQSPNFETFKCSGKNLPNSSRYFPSHKSVFLQILHHFLVPWKITPLYFFRSNITYFSWKEPIKVQIFEIFECSDKNSPCSCQFRNKKSVFLQILHQSSES